MYWTRYVGHCWRRRNKLISDELLSTASHEQAKAGRPARTNIQQLCANTGCSPEDLSEAMDDRERWQERVRISVLMVRYDDDDLNTHFWLTFKFYLTSFSKCDFKLSAEIIFIQQNCFRILLFLLLLLYIYIYKMRLTKMKRCTWIFLCIYLFLKCFELV